MSFLPLFSRRPARPRHPPCILLSSCLFYHRHHRRRRVSLSPPVLYTLSLPLRPHDPYRLPPIPLSSCGDLLPLRRYTPNPGNKRDRLAHRDRARLPLRTTKSEWASRATSHNGSPCSSPRRASRFSRFSARSFSRSASSASRGVSSRSGASKRRSRTPRPARRPTSSAASAGLQWV